MIRATGQETVKVEVVLIRLDGGTQMRDGTDQATVERYAADMEDLAEKREQGEIVPGFPPPLLFFDGTDYWPGDGFHRIRGHILRWQRKGKAAPAMECVVRAGTRRDAILYAAQANAAHGLPRTAADKRRAVETLLRDEEWGQWSDREIARRCSVDHKTVGRVRADLSLGNSPVTAERTYTTKYGTVATMRLPERAGGGNGDGGAGAREFESALPAVETPRLEKHLPEPAAARDVPFAKAAGDEIGLAYIEQVQELRELGYVVSDTPGHIGVYVTAGPEGPRGFFSDPARALEQARGAVRQAAQPQAVEQVAAQPAGGAEAGVDHKEAMEKFRELGYPIYWDKGPDSIADKPWRLHTPRKGQPDLMEHYATLDEALAAAIEGGPTAGAMAAAQQHRQLAAAAPAQAAANGETAMDRMAVHYSSKTVEHYTPREVIEAVLEVWGQIDLDPCSNSRSAPNVPAMRHFTATENGLAQEWSGKAYINPPYGTEIGGWVAKFGEERAAGRVTEAIWLIPARTDTQWFRALTAGCTLACFVSGRLRFGGNGEGDPAPFPSMLVYFGRRDEEFARVFRRLGPIWAMVQSEVEDGVPV